VRARVHAVRYRRCGITFHRLSLPLRCTVLSSAIWRCGWDVWRACGRAVTFLLLTVAACVFFRAYPLRRRSSNVSTASAACCAVLLHLAPRLALYLCLLPHSHQTLVPGVQRLFCLATSGPACRLTSTSDAPTLFPIFQRGAEPYVPGAISCAEGRFLYFCCTCLPSSSGAFAYRWKTVPGSSCWEVPSGFSVDQTDACSNFSSTGTLEPP
jgi:hypothetical protein